MTARLRSLVVAVMVLAGSGAAHQSPFAVENVQLSASHPRLVLAARPTADATLKIVFNAGSLDDGVASGVTRLSQRMMLESNGAEDTRRFHQDVYESASTVTVETETRQASFTLTADKAHFTSLATRMLKLVLDPSINAKGLGRARRLTLNDELEGGSLADYFRFIAASVALEGAEGGGDDAASPYGDPLVVRELTVGECKKHIDKRFNPANATVIVTGAFDRDAITKALKSLSGGKARAPFKRSDLRRLLPMRFDKMMRRELHMQVQLMEMTSPRDIAAARMLAPLLNDHIMWQLRAQGVTYSTGTFSVVQPWLDFLLIVVPVANANDIRVDKILAEMLKKVREGGLDDEEFQAARNFAMAEMHHADVESALLANELSVGLGRLHWFDASVEAELKTLTKAQFLEVVNPWLDPQTSITFVFGRRDASPGSSK